MEAIKQFIRTPQNHEVRIKIPQYVSENDLVEIILIVKKRNDDYKFKINELKTAMNDDLFLSDLREVSDDFKNIDLVELQESIIDAMFFQLGLNR